jgi:myo-inositol catabolism protein IolS
MDTRALGRSGLQVSSVGLGTNYVGGYGLYANIDEAEGIRLVQKALDLGINFIDTADIYGFGRSEELVGEAIAGRRDEVILATKGANAFTGTAGTGARTGVNNEPKYLRSALEASLRRLNTDYVDLYYIHRHDDRTPPEESYGELMRMKDEGLIRAGGVSNFEPAHIRAALQAGPVDALQSCYNLLEREVEAEVLSLCDENGIGFVPWGPLAYGLLGGRYEGNFVLPEGDWRQRTGLFDGDAYKTALQVANALKSLGKPDGTPPAHLATQWLLHQTAVCSVIAGAKTTKQVEQNAAAASAILDHEDAVKVSALTSA